MFFMPSAAAIETARLAALWRVGTGRIETTH
jgi:hypothetical protein